MTPDNGLSPPGRDDDGRPRPGPATTEEPSASPTPQRDRTTQPRQCAADTSAARLGQIQPIDSTHPCVDTLFLGSLLWSPPEAIRNVLEFVHDDDLENPTAAVVLSAIRTLAATSQTAGPQLVLDEVRREGRMKPAVAEQLWRATLSGAESAWRKEYGGAVLAESLRRRVESFGVALVSASREAAEPDLAPLVTRAAETVRDCAERLAVLRGEN